MNETKFPECTHVFKNAVTSDTVAQRPVESFANSLQNTADYEEISDGDVPF